MKKILLVLTVTLSILSYGQYNKVYSPAKVYLKNGEVKEGKATINDDRARLGLNGVGFGIKNKNYMKEILFVPNNSKRKKSEKISIDEIEKIEFEIRKKMFSKKIQTVVYRPVLIENDVQICKEIVPEKLYASAKIQAIDMSPKFPGDSHPQRLVYYIKNGNIYEKTTLASIKNKYNCSMDDEGNREEKIAKCLQGK
ncbi:hypothetical protein Ga0061079_1153 [Apibacter mensalis]|uniref:Uncharacterized protein n=1 Tax=Apibacter mensalis TaxID=1586267 RepID=A0A0X3ASI7_9FLAO|nr:hypothetical protein [Apibacter mensalis]CVK17037.1 hypothetical protein Ga0061079_1153 [Apibacter mensalis]